MPAVPRSPIPTGQTSSSAPPAPTPPPTSSPRTSVRPSTAPTRRTTGRHCPTSPSTSACAGSIGSPYSEQNNYVSNFDPITQTILTTTPGATGANITSVAPSGGVYNSTLVDPDLNDFAPRVPASPMLQMRRPPSAAASAPASSTTPAPARGDILGINAPQALFVAVNQNNLKPIHNQPLRWLAHRRLASAPATSVG